MLISFSMHVPQTPHLLPQQPQQTKPMTKRLADRTPTTNCYEK